MTGKSKIKTRKNPYTVMVRGRLSYKRFPPKQAK